MTSEKYQEGVSTFFSTILGDGQSGKCWGTPHWKGARAIRSLSLQDGVLTIVREAGPSEDIAWLNEFYGHASQDPQTGDVTVRFAPDFEQVRTTDNDRPTRISLSFTGPKGTPCGTSFWHTENYHYFRNLRLAEQHRNRTANVARKKLPQLIADGAWEVSKEFDEDGQEVIATYGRVQIDRDRLQLHVTWDGKRHAYRAKRLEVHVQYRDGVPVLLTLERRGKKLLQLIKAA